MANNETTTKFRVDISELKSAMQEAKRQVALANSEFKATSSSMDDWTKSTDGISAKLKQLNSNLKMQESVLEEYEKTLEKVKKEYGENSKEASEYETKLNNQKATVNKTKSEIKKFEMALSEISDSEKEASKAGKDVTDSISDMAKESKNAGDGFTVLKGAVAEFVGNGLTALADGLKNAIGNLVSLASETREYREDMSKLETAFETAGFTAEQASDVYKEFYAVLGEEDRSVEAVNHLAKMVDTEKDLQTWTDICTGVWATFGDSLPIEGLTEAANETAKTGAVTGVLSDALNWAGASEDEFQKKLEGLSTEQERSAFITETLNGLYSNTAEAYRENNESVMAANRAQSDYTDTLAAMGEKIEPLTTTVKAGVTGLLNEFLKLVQDVDMEAFAAKIEEGFGVLKDEVLPAVKDGLGWIIDNKDIIIAGLTGIAAGFLGFKVASLIQGVTSAMQGMTLAQYALNLAMSLNPIGIVVALIAGLVTAFVTLWNKSESFRAFWIGLWDNIKSFCANAIDSIVGFFTETIPNAIDNMVTFLSELPSKVWDWLVNTINKVALWGVEFVFKAGEAARDFVNKIIEFVKELPSKVWDWLTDTINKVAMWGVKFVFKAGEAARDFVNKIIEFVKQLPSKIWDWLTSAVSKVVSFGFDLVAKGMEAGEKFVTSIVDAVKSLPEKFVSLGKDVISGLWNGISGAIGGLFDNIKNAMSGLVDKAKNALGIHSPSKIFADEVGKWIPEGISLGINKNAKDALNSVKELSSDMVGTVRKGLRKSTSGVAPAVTGGQVVNNFNQIINSPKAINRLDVYRQTKNLLGYAGGVN